MGYLGESLFKALAKTAEPRLADFKGGDLARIVWVVANAGQKYGYIFRALPQAAVPHLGVFSAQVFLKTASAFATAGQSNDHLFIALASALRRRVDD